MSINDKHRLTLKRRLQDENKESVFTETTKKLKIQNAVVEYHVYVPAKSKKELRLERKANKHHDKMKEESGSKGQDIKQPLTREEKRVLRKQQKKEEVRDQRMLMMKERREAKKMRKLKRLNKEMNAPGGSGGAYATKEKKLKDMISKEQNNEKKAVIKEEESAMNVFNALFHGTHDDTTGMMVLRMGVHYTDVIVGKGRVVQDTDLVTVRYKLKGGKFGAVIDSSKKFTFRVGKGEVIKGWDIGVLGMQVGGQRHLIVPPKAGYGSEDIGAGPGATLFFDITLLSMK